MSDGQLAANRALWDELTAIHERSAFYDVEGFLAGASSLSALELDELGPEVAGKRLLHLQCHFGLDTLSWARLGATVTGVDFSGQAITLARRLAAECGLPATFIESDLYELAARLEPPARLELPAQLEPPARLDQRFDVVYTSWGVLCWLPDLARWARLIADCLAPRGIFYIAEFHPFLFALADDSEEPLVSRDAYFHRAEPHAWANDGKGSYADPDAHVEAPVDYEWDHPLGEIVTALIEAGLTIEYLHEFRRLGSRQTLDWPCIGQRPDGSFALRRLRDEYPLSFSLRAAR
ncbi:MAG: class I SAM-dependent methyltransferase [Thermoleophilia bacterium]